jgi:Leucine-rich repeat (LRR) protein
MIIDETIISDSIDLVIMSSTCVILPCLRTIDFTENHFTELPAFLSLFSSLQKIVLTKNVVGTIPLCISRLSNLVELHLSGNAFIHFPFLRDDIDYKESADKTEDKQDSHLTLTPKRKHNKKRLIEMQFDTESSKSQNSLSIHLQKMRSDKTTFRRVQSERRWRCKRQQHISKENIEKHEKLLFNGLGRCLELLNLSHNQLCFISAHTAKLTSLRSLDLSCNRLTSIPHSFRMLSNLESLNISCNCLKEMSFLSGIVLFPFI